MEMKKFLSLISIIVSHINICASHKYGQTFIITPSQLFPVPISGRSWHIIRDPQFYDEDVTEKLQKKEETLPPPEVYSLHVESRIKYRYAQTLVTSRVANPANKSQEVQFTVILPDTAFISSFKMEIKGKIYKAYVKEKDEAKKIYQDALDSGSAAAHVGLSARDSNQFTVSVNVEPNSKVTFNLTYEELLSRILGTYTHAINLNPGQLVRDLAVDVYIIESQPISKLHVPELHSGNEVNPEKDENENLLAKVQWLSKNKVHIRYAPSLEQQQVMSKEKDEESLGGQFRVQYDVEKTNPGGELLVNEGYFVHFFGPSDLPPLRKLAIFVLDVSGSMEGRKLEQLKQAMSTILDDLPPTDFFNIIEFSYSVTVWNLDTLSASAVFQPESPADGLWWFTKSEGISSTTTPSTTTPLPEDFNVPAYPATSEYKLKAKDVINKMRAGGGTNIHGALKTALLVSKVGFKNLAANNSKPDDNTGKDNVQTTIVPSTIDNSTPATVTTISDTIETDGVESATSGPITTTTISMTTVKNTEDDKQIKMAPEPIIIFLTDGDATVGYTKPSKILSMVKEINLPKCAIFSLAFGEGADFSFLRRLSLANSGFARNIYEAADAALQLNSFYKQVASPLLSNITFSYVPGQVVNNSVTLKNFHTLFLGSELVVAGKLNKPQKIEARVCGLTANGTAEYDVQLVNPDLDNGDADEDFKENGSIESNEDTFEDCSECSGQRDGIKSQKKKKKPPKVPTLERLWAYLTIKQLLDRKHVLDNDSGYLSEPTLPEKEIIDVKKKALRLALKYSFVTALTSLVVVKPNSTTESLDTEKLKSQQHKFFSHAFAARPVPLGLDSSSFNPKISSLHFVPNHNVIEKMDTSYLSDSPDNQEKLQFLPLEEVAWLNDIINTDNETITLPLGVNGTKQQYRIGLNETNTEFQECFSPATNLNELKSHCRHLVHCIIPEIVPSVSEYIRYFCPIQGGYAGVCCPYEGNNKETTDDITTIMTEQLTENSSDYTTPLSTSEEENSSASTTVLSKETTTVGTTQV
ncbi:inter-alpha-trypsin inhibitor heavy chain H4-like isoform X2 [Lycorma delicatula]|uniref:inter-alpha-trypsin inhibitor heavy chain H4-like isoform X2 n=1 Tax=Lycorma delicatula TaxID=130591 RepID=UPI003F50EDC5